jgi:hypothetical protein
MRHIVKSPARKVRADKRRTRRSVFLASGRWNLRDTPKAIVRLANRKSRPASWNLRRRGKKDAGFDTNRDVAGDETVERVEVFATPVNAEQATFASDQVDDAALQQDDDAAPTLVFTDNEPIQEGITLADLTLFSCRWPIGNPRDLTTFRYCGEATPSAPYCNCHSRLAYLKRKT